eukprot:SAG31_NODE_2132_length_6374_cov_2.836813_4_plen_242_part_00
MPDATVGLPPIGKEMVVKRGKKSTGAKEDKKAVGPLAEIEAAMAEISGGAKSAAAIARIQDQQDDYARKTDQEQKKLHELTIEVKKLERTLLEEKVRMGGVNAQKHAEEAIGKQVKNLEKRLDKARVKYNDAIAYNKHLCAEIETTRYELTAGKAAIREQQKMVQESQEKLRDLAEQMQDAYIERDQAHAGVQQLKAQAAVAKAEFMQNCALAPTSCRDPSPLPRCLTALPHRRDCQQGTR